MLVEQVAGRYAERAGTAQRAVVVDRGGRDAQVRRRGQATVAVEDAIDHDGCVAAASDTAVLLQTDQRGLEAQGAETAQATVACIGAGQLQVDGPVAADQAVNPPVAATAYHAVGAEQLARGGLGQLIDIHDQVPGLDRRAVGPAISRHRQVAVGHQLSAGLPQVGLADAEQSQASVQQLATHVLNAAGVQAHILAGGFQGAVVVIEQATDVEHRGAVLAQGAQLAFLVAQAGGQNIQAVLAFDDAGVVVQRPRKVKVDATGTDLPAAAVVHAPASDPDLARGVYPTVAIVDIRSCVGDHDIASLCSHASAVVEQPSQGSDAESLGLDRAALAVHVIAVFQHTGGACLQRGLDAGQHAATVVQVGGEDTQLGVLGDDAAALVIDVAGYIHGDQALALQRALGVIQAGGIELDLGSTAGEQAFIGVVDRAGGADQQLAIGGDGAFVAVVQAGGAHGHDALAG
ncbi:hypothetical protein PFLU4_38540 [Pseudomonas fluorescens]|nr:hypothetical protein PFLU4_38540 [Pseudomonas fluorescens]